MKRADELFTFLEHTSPSQLIEGTWQTESVPEETFVSTATCHWEMVVTRQPGSITLTVRGPETRASQAPIPQDAEFFGITFSLGTFMPGLPLGRLVDGAANLPVASGSRFVLDGVAWDLPGPDDADVFVDRLARAGLLVHDPVAAAALRGDVAGVSTRTVERRVARATGLTRSAIRQIERAGRAVDLLSCGVPAADVAYRCGYADQPHLTRSLRRFVGQTPARIASRPGGDVSLPFKTAAPAGR